MVPLNALVYIKYRILGLDCEVKRLRFGQIMDINKILQVKECEMKLNNV